MLGQLGFPTLAGRERIQDENDTEPSWVRVKDRAISASSDGRLIRVRQVGKVFFKKEIDMTGTMVLDWGVLLSSEDTLLLAETRKSGSDECPNSMAFAKFRAGVGGGEPSPGAASAPASTHPPEPLWSLLEFMRGRSS